MCVCVCARVFFPGTSLTPTALRRQAFSACQWHAGQKASLFWSDRRRIVPIPLDCYWVGSFDFNFLVEIKLGFPVNPPKVDHFLQGGRCSNQVRALEPVLELVYMSLIGFGFRISDSDMPEDPQGPGGFSG